MSYTGIGIVIAPLVEGYDQPLRKAEPDAYRLVLRWAVLPATMFTGRFWAGRLPLTPCAFLRRPLLLLADRAERVVRVVVAVALQAHKL